MSALLMRTVVVNAERQSAKAWYVGGAWIVPHIQARSMRARLNAQMPVPVRVMSTSLVRLSPKDSKDVSKSDGPKQPMHIRAWNKLKKKSCTTGTALSYLGKRFPFPHVFFVAW